MKLPNFLHQGMKIYQSMKGGGKKEKSSSSDNLFDQSSDDGSAPYDSDYWNTPIEERVSKRLNKAAQKKRYKRGPFYGSDDSSETNDEEDIEKLLSYSFGKLNL